MKTTIAFIGRRSGSTGPAVRQTVTIPGRITKQTAAYALKLRNWQVVSITKCTSPRGEPPIAP